MINISLAYVYQLAVNLEPLANLPREGRHADFIFPLFQAESALTALTQQSLFGPYLRTSWGHCQALLAELRRIAADHRNRGCYGVSADGRADALIVCALEQRVSRAQQQRSRVRTPPRCL